jgi:hypothetical protein
LRLGGPGIANEVITGNTEPGGQGMANFAPKAIIDEHCAAVLLGLTPPELRWFSRVLGLGYKLENGSTSQVFFTYEELKRLSSAAATSAK